MFRSRHQCAAVEFVNDVLVPDIGVDNLHGTNHVENLEYFACGSSTPSPLPSPETKGLICD